MVTRVQMVYKRCAEVIPQGTFSCGVAAIHLGAPYGILQSLLYARAAFAGMDKKKTACSHRRFSPIYF